MRPTSGLARLLGLVLAIASAAAGFDRALRAQDPQDVSTWASLGPIPHARTGAAAVVLNDGRTLIAGGTSADGSATDTVIAFDPATNEVTSIGRLLAPRVGHTATLLADGRVLVTGGTTDGVISSDLEVVDPASGASSLVASLVQPRTGHAAAALADGTVLIVGGTTVDRVTLASAELFDPETSAVRPVVGAMQAARFDASATTLLDGRVLVVGGNDGSQDLASAELFEPWSETFSALDAEKHLSVPRAGHTALLLPNNNSVLIAGGRSNGAAVATADVFVPPIFPDPYTFGVGQFAATGPMTIARARAISAPAGNNGYAFVMGGGPADAELYRFATLKTDKDDYAPGERATITGSGWQPSEDVTLIFQEDPAVHDDYVLHVTADAQGDLYWNQWAPEQHDLNVRFYLTAVGSRSHAQMTFTDSQPGAVVLTPPSASVEAGTSGVYQVKVTKNGNNNSCVLTFSAAYTGEAPIGTALSFSSNPVTMTTADVTTTLTLSTTNAGPNRTQPGTYGFRVSATPGAGCQGGGNASTTDGTLVVNGAPAAPTTLTAAAATGTYGGTVNLSATLTASGSGVSGKTIAFTLNGSSVGSATTNASGVATLNGVSLAGIDGGTYATAVGASFAADSSYQASAGSSSLTVNKADATISVLGYTGVYDGNAHHATGTATGVNGEDLSSLLSLGDSLTNAPGGTATWSFAGNGNYNAASGTASILISKADATVAVNGYTGIYDGAAHGATGSATGVQGENLGALLTLGDTFTNVPGGTATWNFSGDGNYNSKTGTASIVLSKADATVTVNGYTGIYDGAAHGATGSATGVQGENLSALLTLGDSFTNVPGGTATWNFSGDGNYNSKTGTASIVLSKADATVTVNGYSGVYDGAAHGATGSATGVQGENLSALLTLGDSFTNVPGGTATWNFSGDGNYNSKTGTASIVLSKADATVTVNGYSGVYDGAAHGATGSATGVQGESLSALLTLGDSFTNVPGGTANWSFAGDTNYNAANGTASIVLSRADANITVSGYTGVYDGAAHGATGSATGVNAEDLSALLTLGDSFTNVPGGPANWSFAGDANYNAASGTASIVISKADANITVSGYTGVYDGNAHGATGSATGVNAEDLSSLLNLGVSFTNAPGGTATWTFAGDTNYNAATSTASIVISKADANITVNGYTGVYDGNAHGATGTATGINGEDLSSLLNLGGSFTSVPGGTATWTFAGDTNYNAATSTASIVISKADANITVNGYTGVYDGDAHGATGTATGVKGEDLSSLLNLGGSFTSVPGGTANWSFAGDVNYNYKDGTLSIVISKADANITVNGYTGVYDGQAHGATGTATGAKSQNLSALLSLGDSFTNVPGGTANWSFAGDGNHNAASGTANIVISKADANITVNGYTGVYDGHAHGATGGATGVQGENLSALLSLGDSFTNVPGGTANWSFAGSSNYKATSGTASIVIAKAEQVITWATPAPVVYGTPLSSAQLNATRTVGDGALTYSPAAGAVLPVGWQVLAVSAAATVNYNAASIQVTLQVTPWHATGFYRPVTMGGPSIVNTIKGGSTVPLKFNLYTSVGGTELTAVNSIVAFQVYPMSCSAGSLEDPVDLTTTGGTSLRYDTVERQFIQNWQSPKGAGNCYEVAMTAKDGTTLLAFFKTK